ncbi:MAG: 16S rRNA (adenine(1518)-N(6)/adenine(1519)-N(6))-dimethyltransferase RsmA [Patescibacteria group bacterium]|jgi:16S rRNA (adenine1518-N6/adenine1519-N6)-dimethyltransferase
MTKEEIKYLLQRYDLTPNKLRGQNFLLDEEVLDDIVVKAKVSKDDLVLEVGPGLGALTQKLAAKADGVVAFEIEKSFKTPLAKIAKVNNNINLQWQDILTLSPKQWQAILAQYKKTNYKIVANIPYYLTGKFIQRFVAFDPVPQSLTLMVQKEVAQRIEAKDKKMSLLALAVQLYGQVEILRLVSKKSFWPEPKVDSAVIHIFGIKKWSYPVDEKKTWQLIKRGFAKKRKKLVNNLLSDQDLDKESLSKAFQKMGLSENVRAENLEAKLWVKLAELLYEK